MKQHSFLRKLQLVLAVQLVLIIFAGTAWAVEATIVGTVNDDYQIVTPEGMIYEVAENELGDELVLLAGERVSVTGSVALEEDTKTITVSGFDILEE